MIATDAWSDMDEPPRSSVGQRSSLPDYRRSVNYRPWRAIHLLWSGSNGSSGLRSTGCAPLRKRPVSSTAACSATSPWSSARRTMSCGAASNGCSRTSSPCWTRSSPKPGWRAGWRPVRARSVRRPRRGEGRAPATILPEPSVKVSRFQPRNLFHGPVMASVIPGTWMLTNRTLPSGEKVGPVNSEYVGAPLLVPMLIWLRAIA